MTPEARARLEQMTADYEREAEGLRRDDSLTAAGYADDAAAIREALATIDAQAARVRELEEKLMAASYRVAVHRPRRPDTKTGSAG